MGTADPLLSVKTSGVHLWLASDEAISDLPLLAKYRTLLDDAEAQQWLRFRHPRHRHQYLVSRALLRYVLGLYLGIAPTAVRFQKNAFGKPFLADGLGHGLRFNLSHTEGCIALAVAHSGDLGVDVEAISRTAFSLDIARKFFAPAEFAQLLRTPAALQNARFVDLWTLKEAYIKACGEGLSIALDQFAFVFQNDEGVDIRFSPGRTDEPDRWQFWQVRTEEAYRLAIAHRSASPRQPAPIVVRRTIPLDGHAIVHPQVIRSLPEFDCVASKLRARHHR